MQDALEPARHPEGRFHHSGQRALYVSPERATAGVAIDSYYRPGDAPRVIVPLYLESTALLDFRDLETSTGLGLGGQETRADWRDERARGSSASSWRASDAARNVGADGIIYPSRKVPSRWHLVLFRWNEPGAACLRENGLVEAFVPDQMG